MSNEQVVQIVRELKTSMRTKYVEAQKKFIKTTNLKVGDKVKIVRKSFDHELGWDNKWCSDMNDTIGKIGVVREIMLISGISISILGDGCWNFPFFVLEKVEEPKYTFKDKEVVLVRDGDDEYWQIKAFKEYTGYDYPYGCYNSSRVKVAGWKQCIPYKGHEHLLGTRCPADC